jgi:GT2 family glycosyltransferase
MRIDVEMPVNRATLPGLGIVVIGRNEGDRLERCLRSVQGAGAPIVYVDSGSRDQSPARARALGVDVVELDPARPFTAARGRNEGFAKLTSEHPQVDRVQFLDGDTEVIAGWLERASDELARDPSVVAVCGRRRERAPDASVYNLLCDLEWNTPVGETTQFGGDVMIRVDAFRRAGGYDDGLIAGEDPDLAVRLHKDGGRILRVDQDMTWHDAAMTSFSQWWTRAVRGGHAFAEGAERHADLRFWAKEVKSNWAWGAALPALGVGMFLPTLGTSLVGVAGGYGLLFAKVQRDARRRGLSPRDSTIYAAFTTLAKVPQAVGQARYVVGKARGKKARIIEYK